MPSKMPTTSSTSSPVYDQMSLKTLSTETLERLATGCSICMDDLSLKTLCLDRTCLDRACNHVVQTKCKHMFHHQCIYTWLDMRDIHSDGTCPYCRAILVRAKPPRFELTSAISELAALYPDITAPQIWTYIIGGMTGREVTTAAHNIMMQWDEQITWAMNGV
jgi:hypothetical protein